MRPLIFILTLLVAAFSVAEEQIEESRILPLLNPTFKERKSVKLRLDNGLEAYLISDPNTGQSGAVLSVNVGSWSDPDSAPGAAHFVEHMLFHGTKKYPQEGEYFRYIRDNGGIANAFTASDQTSYLFTINNEAFEGAVDRLSHFFTSPLFKPSGVSRELTAIDQEYGKNVENDMRRLYEVHKSRGNPAHPETRFSMGNRKSLADTSAEELKKWHKEHYSANLMRLVVISPMPMDKLRPLIVEKFSAIPNRSLVPYEPAEPVTSPDAAGEIVFLPPVKELRKLTLIWELPPKFSEMIESKPDKVACHILGHEGEKSLLAELKREGLAESIGCGGLPVGGKNMEFYLDIGLTDKGVKEWPKAAALLFQAVAGYQKAEVPRYLFDELKASDEMLYQHQPRKPLFYTLMEQAQTVFNEPLASYPEKSHVIGRFDPEAVGEIFSLLTPDRAQLYLTAPESLTKKSPDRLEKWLQIPYSIEPVGEPQLASWSGGEENPKIGFPEKNPFIAEAPEILNMPGKPETLLPPAKLLMQNSQGEFFYAPDDRFGEPDVSFHLRLRTPEIKESDPRSVVMAELYLKAVEETLLPVSYPAKTAGLDFSLKRFYNGIDISVEGISAKAPLLFRKLLESLKQPKLTSEEFALYRASLLREWESFKNEMPVKLAFEELKQAVYKEFVTSEEKAAAMRELTFEEMERFEERLFDRTYLQGVVVGNIAKEEAAAVAEEALNSFSQTPYPKEEQFERELIDLPAEGGPYFLEKQIAPQGSAALLAIEALPYSLEARGAQQLLMKAVSEPFFTELRTKQQTGYIVHSSAEEIERHLFNIFAVQSNSHAPRDLLARFELFIERFLQELEMESLPKERFEKIKAALIEELKDAVKNVEQAGKMLQLLATEYGADFDWMEKRLAALRELEYSRFAEIAKSMFGKQNKRRLGILLQGEVDDANGLYYEEASSIEALQNIPNR